MTWTADSEERRRDASFLEASERGLYVGSWSATASGATAGGETLRKNSSEALVVLADRCIFSGEVGGGHRRRREWRGQRATYAVGGLARYEVIDAGMWGPSAELFANMTRT